MSETAPRLRFATASITGRRQHNEDGVLCAALPGDRTLLAVADGMGGHAAGEVASALALEALHEAVQERTTLAGAFALANRRVHAAARSDATKQGMGTTLVAVLIEGSSFHLANVGDSRAYLLSGQQIQQISQDHSFLAEAVRRGRSEEEAHASRWKDALTRSIGTEADVKVDVFGPFPFEPASAILLCSDGLYKTLAEADLRDVFTLADDLDSVARALVSAAHERGSDDNITVAIAELGQVPRRRPGDTIPIVWPPPGEREAPAAAAAAPPTVARSPGPVETAGEAKRGGPWGLVVAMTVVALVAAAVFLLLGR